MRHIITVLLTAVFFICINSTANGAMTHNKEVTLKEPLVKEDLTKRTKAVKKSKVQKLSKKSAAKEKVVIDMDAKPVRKIASNKKVVLDMDTKTKKKSKLTAASKKSLKKKYWSVQCRQGFIKDSYVYCARGIASVAPAKKHSMKKVAMKKAKATSIRK